MVAAAVIGAGVISAGASIYSSQQAAGAQTSAANQANATQQNMYNLTRGDLSPYNAFGQMGGASLANMMGLSLTGLPMMAANQNGAQAPSLSPGMLAAQQSGPHSQNGLLGGNGYAAPLDLIGGSLFGKKNASPIQDIAGALAAGHPVKDSDWAKAGYGPGGTLTAGQTDPLTGKPYQPPVSLASANPTTPGHGGGAYSDAYTGTLLQQPQFQPVSLTQDFLRQTPGYQFNLDQGLRSVQNSAAARGLGSSGAALKGAAQYATGLADSTYQNQFANAMANNLNLYNSQVTNQNNIYNRLMGITQLGENAAAQTGAYGTQTGSNIAQTTIGAGNALAGSYLQQGAAVGGAANSISNLYLMNALSKSGGGTGIFG